MLVLSPSFGEVSIFLQVRSSSMAWQLGKKKEGEGEEDGEEGQYLRSNKHHGSPVDARQDIQDQLGARVDGVLDELAVLGLQGIAGGAGFAGLDSAGQEVEGEELHCCCLCGEVLFGIW